MKLNIYTDESLVEIKRVVEADKLKVPYRVAIYIIESLDKINLENETDVLRFIGENINKLDKIIKATFGITDSELECVDTAELINVAKDLYKWGIDKVSNIKGGAEKNALETV